MWVGITTGCRISEIFGLDEWHFDKAKLELMVEQQMNRKSSSIREKTKNRTSRKTLVLQSGVKYLERVLAEPIEKRLSHLGRDRYAEVLRKSIVRSGVRNHHLNPKTFRFHDLRHSFAVHMLGLGASIDEISKLLGDTVEVCNRYYLGSELPAASLDRLRKLLTT